MVCGSFKVRERLFWKLVFGYWWRKFGEILVRRILGFFVLGVVVVVVDLAGGEFLFRLRVVIFF